MQRRNLYKAAQPLDSLAMELLSIEELQARADGGLRVDAPVEAARARERLVQIYRRRCATGPYLNLYRPRRERAEPWGDGDVEGLAWLCRLAESGHVGAARIAGRAIQGYARMMTSEPLRAHPVFKGAAGCRLMSLANRHARVARGLAMIEAFRPDTDIAALADWLELAGAAHTQSPGHIPELAEQIRSLAAQIRELIEAGAADIPEEVHIIRRRARAELGGNDFGAMELASEPLTVEIGRRRLERHRMEPLDPAVLEATLSMLEGPSGAGSHTARETLWLFRHAAAADKAHFLREWLKAGAKTPNRYQEVSLVVAMALDEGKLGDPADAGAAIPWYASAVRERLSGNPIDGTACASIGYATAKARNFPLAFRWLERGIALGNSECLAQWMEIRTREKTGVGLDVDAVLEFARAHFTRGAPIPDNYSIESARMRAGIYFDEKMAENPPDPVSARKWLEVCALLGSTQASERLREFDTAPRATERPVG